MITKVVARMAEIKLSSTEMSHISSFENIRRKEDALNRSKIAMESVNMFFLIFLPGLFIVSTIYIGDLLYGADREGDFLLLLIIKICVKYIME